MVSDVYLFSTRRNLFKTVYRMGETVSTGLSLQSPVYMANKLYAKRLYDYIVDNGFDTVVCTHLFPAEALTALKRAGRLDRKTVFAVSYTHLERTQRYAARTPPGNPQTEPDIGQPAACAGEAAR